MAQNYLGEEAAKFFEGVYLATRKGVLEWEQTASPSILAAPLGDDYVVQLSAVADLEDRSETPDHVLTLYKGQQELLAIDRRDVSINELGDITEPGLESTYSFFKDLWYRSMAKATKLDQHLSVVNKLLDKKLQSN